MLAYEWKSVRGFTWLHVTCEVLQVARKGLLKVTVTHSRIHSIRSKGGNMPETVQDKNVVTANQYQEMIFGPSNTATSEDLNWPLRSFTHCKSLRMRFFSYSGTPVGWQDFPLRPMSLLIHRNDSPVLTRPLTCYLCTISSLWSPYVIGQTIIFLPCDFYLSSFFLSFFPRLISAAVDWMSTILPHMV